MKGIKIAMKFVYKTERLYLKVLGPEQAPDVLSFLNNNRLIFEPYETYKHPSYYTLSHQSDILQAELNAFISLKYIRYYLFEKNDENTIIGTVSFSNILPEPFCSCTLGYKIDAGHQRMGYAKEAITAATTAMFSDFGIHRIEAYVLHNNIPSIKLLDSLGFTNEGLCRKCIKIQKEYKDHYLYSLISPFSS